MYGGEYLASGPPESRKLPLRSRFLTEVITWAVKSLSLFLFVCFIAVKKANDLFFTQFSAQVA